MGFFPRLYAGDRGMLADPTGKRWYDMVQAGGQKGVQAATEIIVAFSQNKFRGRRKVQRPGRVHRVHRLRVDVEHRRQQPSPRGHLP